MPVIVFSLSMFLSAALLFLVEPMLAKMMLPRLGGTPAVWCLSFGKRPLRFAAGVAAMLLASLLYVGPFGNIVLTERSFFGVLRVANDSSGKFRTLIHGGTIHGIQSLDPSKSRERLAYYTRSGPAADIMGAVQGRSPQGNWAIVGLGAGAMACYLQHGQTLTYFEINPLVARIAENPKYFSFLEQCAPQAKVVLGDARLELRDMPDAGYGLIVLDAFSGDSIPMHLLTREALALYLRKLAPGGLIAFHISNMYVELAPTLGTLAQDAHLACYLANDTNLSQAEAEQGKMASRWVVMAKDQTDLAALLRQNQVHVRWSPVQARTGAVVWSDDYSNLLSVIKWH